MYRVNIIPGHRADCPDGHDLQNETGNVVTEIETLSRMFGLTGPDITLEFSPLIKRGAVKQLPPKHRRPNRGEMGDGYNCPEEMHRNPDDIFSHPDWLRNNDNYPADWREQNSENMFDLIESMKKCDLPLFDEFAGVVKSNEGIVCIDDVKGCFMNSEADRSGFNWANILKRKIEDAKVSEYLENLLDNMRKSLGYLAATTSLTLGSYCAATRTITIYDVAIKNTYTHFYKEAMISTYAHELFHAVHHDVIHNNHSAEEEELITLESLASCFEYLYCLNQANRGRSPHANHIMANDLYNEWEMYDIMDWPYSGAIAMVDLDYVPAGKNYLFSRTYRKSTLNLPKAYEDIISAYATHEGQSYTGILGQGHSYQTWNVGDYFRMKNNPNLENLYNNLFAALRRAIPSVKADVVYSRAYIRILDDAVNTKKNRRKMFAVVKFERKTNSLYIETNKPIGFVSGFTFTPHLSNHNFEYSFNISSSVDIAEAVKVLKDSYNQMI